MAEDNIHHFSACTIWQLVESKMEMKDCRLHCLLFSIRDTYNRIMTNYAYPLLIFQLSSSLYCMIAQNSKFSQSILIYLLPLLFYLLNCKELKMFLINCKGWYCRVLSSMKPRFPNHEQNEVVFMFDEAPRKFPVHAFTLYH